MLTVSEELSKHSNVTFSLCHTKVKRLVQYDLALVLDALYKMNWDVSGDLPSCRPQQVLDMNRKTIIGGESYLNPLFRYFPGKRVHLKKY